VIDIVDRLRAASDDNSHRAWHKALQREAADEIDRLRPALPAALDLLRRGAGDLGNDARIRWKQEVKDFLNASARSGG